MAPIEIHYFSDILCVWAYVGQIRIDELCRVHGEAIHLEYHYVDVFGDVPGRLEKRWSSKGGLTAYSKHVVDVVSGFDHVSIHDDVWQKNVPTSALSCHQFLHAAYLAEGEEACTRIAWAMREAFFARAEDVSALATQMRIAEELGLATGSIQTHLQDGSALARVSRDLRMANAQGIAVSPTLVFDEGRQTLKGNVSYRIIDANLRELLSTAAAGHSWC